MFCADSVSVIQRRTQGWTQPWWTQWNSVIDPGKDPRAGAGVESRHGLNQAVEYEEGLLICRINLFT